MAALDVAEALSAAIDDPAVAAIVFRIDSPGGSYVGSDTIWREVQRASDLGKPVVVSMGNLAASGGYFIAAAADRIVAQPGTLTGSIGVVSGKVSLRELRSEEHTSALQSLMSISYAVFCLKKKNNYS